MRQLVLFVVGLTLLLFFAMSFLFLDHPFKKLSLYTPDKKDASVEIVDVRNTLEKIEIDVDLKEPGSIGEVCDFNVVFPGNLLRLVSPVLCDSPSSCLLDGIDRNKRHTFVFFKKDPDEDLLAEKAKIKFFFNGLTECKLELSSDEIDISGYMK